MGQGRSATLAALLVATALATWLAAGRIAHAHCDSMDGPVVTEARAALEKGDVTPLLKWVMKEHEKAIRSAFERTLVVRAKGLEARELADDYFFETLVRVHRAGEGAPYTGLKPAGQTAPPVKAADAAIDAGSVNELARNVARAAEQGIKERFERLMEAKRHENESVAAGRRYVEAYVVFVHYVEGLHNMITAGGEHGHGESAHREKATEHDD